MRMNTYPSENAISSRPRRPNRRYTSENMFLQSFTRFQSCDGLTRDMLTALIERIYVDGQDGVRVVFKYRDEYKALCDFVERRSAV